VKLVWAWLAVLAATMSFASAAEPWEGARVTIESFSAALAQGDIEMLGKLLAPEFRLIEDGVEYDRAAALESVRSAVKTATITRKISGLQIAGREPVAWGVYRVHGTFRAGAESGAFERIETIVLARSPDGWHITQATSAQRSTQ
jgi:hypothetical protein